MISIQGKPAPEPLSVVRTRPTACSAYLILCANLPPPVTSLPPLAPQCGNMSPGLRFKSIFGTAEVSSASGKMRNTSTMTPITCCLPSSDISPSRPRRRLYVLHRGPTQISRLRQGANSNLDTASFTCKMNRPEYL